MAARELAAVEVEQPRFTSLPTGVPVEVFDLDSHARAREALDFGLAVAGIGFNIFVVGEDRAGRMTATLAYLNDVLAKRAPPSDWIYLNNPRRPENPTPHRLPAGVGRRFRDRVAQTIPKIRDALAAALSSEAYQARVLALREAMQHDVGDDLTELRQMAKTQGLALVQGEDGALRLRRAEDAPADASQSAEADAAERALAGALARFQMRAVTIQAQLAARFQELNRGIADEVASTLLEELVAEFSGFSGLARWLTEMRVDIVEEPMQFRRQADADDDDEDSKPPEEKYAVNLLVDHGDETHPSVVVESNPTYENLFGRIEYRQASGTMETDFTLIRAGSLHRANGGILVLRAEALAGNPASWAYLKAALRDREIRIEELQRQQTPPIAGAPRPKPIPLDLKVVIVGAPRWYAMFFETDPDFSTYFKIKADIDPDMAAAPRNLGIYAELIAQMTRERGLEGAEPGAIARLLGLAARWAERRDRLTARFELIEDLVTEAAVRAHQAKQPLLTEAMLLATLDARRRRGARIEERAVRSIVEGAIMIATSGGAIGQVNALTVQDAGDRRFGTPVRVTARASAGRAGIVNIERDVELGGPIQQKGAMVLQGFLAGRFAQTRPLSFTCSITFEQSYGGVEGDSASLAELIAVLSDLAQLPIRQDIAMTGSVNQAGYAQAIGGAYLKIEGFFAVCLAQPGGLTGTQGVIVPEANRVNLALRDETAAAIRDGAFHLWSVATVEEAAELLMGTPAGVANADGDYPPDSIFGRVAERLSAFDRILAARREAGCQRHVPDLL
jgi:predicted ATP-dependent protease